MRPPTQWFSDNPCVCSICLNYSPMSGVAMKIYFSNDISVGKGDL